jgi:hypothetical protein
VRIRFAAIVAVLAVFGAACGGGGGHSAKSSDGAPTSSGPSVTATGTPSPTGPLTTGPGVLPGEKPPVMSADAKQHTPAGALAFATYFVRALDWSVATNDTYLVQQVAASSCTACERDITAVAKLRKEGAHETSGRTAVISSKLVTGTFNVNSDLVVEIVTRDEPIVIVRPSAAPSTAAAANPHDVSLVFVSWSDGRWLVVEEGAPS